MTGSLLTLAAGLLWLAAAPGMAWLVLVCLIRCRRRRALAVWTGVFIAALALLTAGGAVLTGQELAWRSGVVRGLYAALFLGGAGAMTAAVCALPELLAGWPERSLRRWRRMAGAALCAAVLGSVVLWRWAAALTAGDDRVVTRNGRQVVEVDEGWMDRCLVYYPYRGPLVRGNAALETVYTSQEVET